MSIIVFSDTHLTHEFDPQTFTALKKVIEPADRIIINGDFWDGYLTTFDQFVASEWSQLFPLLKSKQTTYIFGNHDEPSFMDNNMSLFSTQQLPSITLPFSNTTYVIQHGHTLWADSIVWASSILNRKISSIIYTWLIQEEKKQTIIGRISSAITNWLNQRNHEQLVSIVNALPESDDNTYLFGHTHIPFASVDKKHFNSGKYGPKRFTYLEITPEGCFLKEINSLSS